MARRRSRDRKGAGIASPLPDGRGSGARGLHPRPATPPAAPGDAEKEAPKLATVRPQKKTVRRTGSISRAQNVEAFQHAPLYAKIPGYVKRVHVDIGHRVRAGEPLVELDVPEMDVELKQKEAALLQATAEVELAQSSLKAAEAALKSGQAQVTLRAESGRARVRAEQARVQSQHERLSKVGMSSTRRRSTSRATPSRRPRRRRTRSRRACSPPRRRATSASPSGTRPGPTSR
ncbi:MAG: biotin/lipoyl-binding protein [Gemmataceae bacterium]